MNESKRKKLSKDDRLEIYKKTDGHCAYCGIEIEVKDMQIDHVFPLSRGGLDEKENMFPACRSCNHYKSTMDLEDFREEIGKWHERLIRDSVTYKNAVRFGVVTPTPKKVIFYFEAMSKIKKIQIDIKPICEKCCNYGGDIYLCILLCGERENDD